MAKLVSVEGAPGIFRRHRKGCGGKRCACSYVVTWRHKGRQHTETLRTLAEAREAQGRRRQPGSTRPVSRERFEDYAKAWLGSYQGRTSRGVTETTLERYRQIIEGHAIPYFRAYRLGEIERPDVRAFAMKLGRDGLAPGSVVKAVGVLKVLFATAVEDGTLQVNPVADMRINRRDESKDEPEAKALTGVELAALQAKLPKRWRLLFSVLSETGLRISEALGLDWTDVEFGSKPTLHVRRQFYRGKLKQLKTHNGRRKLPLSAELARKLWAARPASGKGPLFSTRTGTRLQYRNVVRVLDKATEETALDWVTCHSLRHTCASMLFESGRNIRQVAGWLGHADPAFTLRTYVHLLDAGLGGPLNVRRVNAGSTEGMQTGANAASATKASSASQSENAEPLQAAVNT